MPQGRTCSECGTPLGDDAVEGFCPACMLQGALDLGTTTFEFPGSSRKRFGDYEFLEELGRGGMGVVYRARQVSLDRVVALKLILLGTYAGQTSVLRFRAEAAAAAKLQHPNIVAIHEVGEQDGQPFFSMDYVAGRDLDRYAREHPFTAREAAQLLHTLAEAVHYAHEQGILHRDLKPANILIDGAVEPHITDFGLAKRLDGSQPSALSSGLTVTGQVLGSPSFLPPEQALGKYGRVGPCTDVYALGAILYFLLTGRPPFAAETLAETLREVLSEEPLAPRLLNRSAPRDLETICLKCLEKEPPMRYPSARTLAEELNRFVTGEPIHARPIGAPGRAWRWCRRKPAVASLVAATMLSVCLGFVGVLWQWGKSERHRLLAEQKADESRRNLYAADMLLAQQALESENIGHAQEILRKYVPQRGERDLRGWEWRYAWNQCQSDELFTLKEHGVGMESIALSSDGALLASGSAGEARVVVWELKNKKRKRIIDFPAGVTAVLFSRDGQELVVGTAQRQLSFFSTRTWRRTTVLTNDSRIRSLAISPDGKMLAVYSMYSLRLLNLSDRQQSARLALVFASEYLPGGLAFSPDSTSLAYCRGDGLIVVTNLLKANQAVQLKGHTNYVTSLAFSSNGKLLFSGSRDRTVRVWEAESGRELRQLSSFAGFVSSLALSPDERILAVAGAGQRVKLFDTGSWEQSSTLKGHTRDIWAVLFNTDGQTIFTGSNDGSVKAWPVEKNCEPVSQLLPVDTLTAQILPTGKFLYVMHTNRAYSIWRTYPFQQVLRCSHPIPPGMRTTTVSPDARFWVAAPTGGVVKVFRTGGASLVQELPTSGAAVIGLAFSADSRTLAGLREDLTCRIWQRSPAQATQGAEEPFREIANLRFESKRQFISLTFAGTRRLLCAGYNGGLTEIWNISSGTRLADLWGDAWGIFGAAISHNESTMVTASGSGSVSAWDLRSRSQRGVLTGQLVSSFSVVFSPDESRIAACGGDGTVRIWDSETKNPVATIKLHPERLSELEFPDDETLVALAANSYGQPRLFVLRAPKVPEYLASGQKPGSRSPEAGAPLQGGSVAPHRLQAAAAENLALFGLPSRAADTPANLIDLSAFYNLPLEGIEPWHFEVGALQSPQKGRQRFGPVEHDVRGGIVLCSGTRTYLEFLHPRRVDAIPVGLNCRRLHFLHVVFEQESEGTQVASYVLRFADGKTSELPVRYGEELRTWGPGDPEVRVRNPNSGLAWSGTNAASERVRLFQTTWNNPRAKIPIQSIDFVSSMSRAEPMLAAITTEP